MPRGMPKASGSRLIAAGANDEIDELGLDNMEDVSLDTLTDTERATLDEADKFDLTANAPRYDDDQEIPFKAGIVQPIYTPTTKEFIADDGSRMAAKGVKSNATAVHMTLYRTERSQKNHIVEPVAYEFKEKMPFRTDNCKATKSNKFTSADVMRCIMSMMAYGRSITIVPIDDVILANEKKMLSNPSWMKKVRQRKAQVNSEMQSQAIRDEEETKESLPGASLKSLDGQLRASTTVNRPII